MLPHVASLFRERVRVRFSCFWLIAAGSLWPAWGQGGDASGSSRRLSKVPAGEIVIKGAWSSASDSATPVPEGARVTQGVFSDPYFGLTYALPSGWTEKYKGPPPSDSGRYVLAQFSPLDTFRGPARGSILITAQDLFFTSLAANAAELIDYMKGHLQADYKVETPLVPARIADRAFVSFGYWAPAAELHWRVLATEIRCHAVQIVLTSRDTQLLASLTRDMDQMKLPAEASPTGGTGGGAFPVCIKDYANNENTIARVDPVLTEHRFNPVPVRIIIGTDGKVKHVHFLSAFPSQAKAITDVLGHWKFKPHRRGGQPVEVETGILFGHSPPAVAAP